MVDNIVKLNVPLNNLADTLEDMAAKARTGKILGCVLVAVDAGGNVTTGISGPIHERPVFAMIGGLEYEKARLLGWIEKDVYWPRDECEK